MPITSYQYQQPRSVIDASGVNSLYTAVEDATDGTTGRIDDENTRFEAFNRNHFKDSPNFTDSYMDVDNVETGYDPSFTGVWTDFWNFPINLTVGSNEVLRIQFNPLVTTTERQNTAAPAVRANSAFYIQLYVRSGGVDIPVNAPFGYNTICAGDGNTGTSSNKTLFFERLPLSAFFIPQISTAITNIKAKIYFDDGANYKVNFRYLYGVAILHKY